MNRTTNDSKQPKRNITWQDRPLPAHCDHEYEVIVHLLGNSLKRCAKCGHQETEWTPRQR